MRFKSILTIIIVGAAFVFIAVQLISRIELRSTDDSEKILKEGNSWILNRGEYHFPLGLDVPADVSLTIEKGAILKFGSGARLTVSGKVLAVGSLEDPILMTSLREGVYWRGMSVIGTGTYMNQAQEARNTWPYLMNKPWMRRLKAQFMEPQVNRLDHVIFESIGVEGPGDYARYNYMAGLEVSGAIARVSHVKFKDMLNIGAFQAANAMIWLIDNEVTGEGTHKGFHVNSSIGILQRNRILQNRKGLQCNDGLWILSSFILADQNIIDGKGDDGIDLKNSVGFVSRNKILNNKDAAIDVDHASSGVFVDNELSNSIYGIVISDGSSGLFMGNKISSNQIGFLTRGRVRTRSSNNEFFNNKTESDSLVEIKRSPLDESLFQGSEMKTLLDDNAMLSDKVGASSMQETIESTFSWLSDLEKDFTSKDK